MTRAADVPPRAVVLLAVITLVWGTNWPLFPLATREVSVWTFRAVAVLVAGAVLLAVARLRGQPLALPRRAWRTVVAATFFYLVLWNVASTYAAIMIPSGQAAILGFTMPLWTAAIAWLLLGQRLTARLAWALAFGALAVGLLIARGWQAYAQAPAGFGLGLLAGLGWAIGTLILKRDPPAVPATVLTGWQLLITALPIGAVAIVLAALDPRPIALPSWPSVAVIAYIALVPMTIGNVAWFSVVGMLPAQVAGLASVMVPVVAMISGALVHREPLGPVELSAMALTALSLWLALRAPARR